LGLSFEIVRGASLSMGVGHNGTAVGHQVEIVAVVAVGQRLGRVTRHASTPGGEMKALIFFV
jgi:hypothetical protein